jgi:hypothetical protein
LIYDLAFGRKNKIREQKERERVSGEYKEERKESQVTQTEKVMRSTENRALGRQ